MSFHGFCGLVVHRTRVCRNGSIIGFLPSLKPSGKEICWSIKQAGTVRTRTGKERKGHILDELFGVMEVRCEYWQIHGSKATHPEKHSIRPTIGKMIIVYSFTSQRYKLNNINPVNNLFFNPCKHKAKKYACGSGISTLDRPCAAGVLLHHQNGTVNVTKHLDLLNKKTRLQRIRA